MNSLPMIFAAIGLVAGLMLKVAGVGGSVVGLSMLSLLVILPLFGVLITIDDHLPGGFSNPDGTTPLPWRYREFWAELGVRFALTGVGFALDVRLTTGAGSAFALTGGVGVVLALALARRDGKFGRRDDEP